MHILSQKICTRTKKVLFLFLLVCAFTPNAYGARAALTRVQHTLTTHGQTISNGAIWAVDTVYLLGKLFPNRISKSVTTSAFATLNYIGLCALGFYFAQMEQHARTAFEPSQKDHKLTRCVAGAQSFCMGIAALDTIMNALAATYAVRGQTKTATKIYAQMLPWAETAFVLTILIDIYHMTQKQTRERLEGASDLTLKGLGYASMALSRRHPNSLTQACCWWSMATLYGIKNWIFLPLPHTPC